MEKNKGLRWGLGCLQHLLAGLALVLYISLSLSARVEMPGLYGITRTYVLDLQPGASPFLQSPILGEIMQDTLGDVAMLAVAKEHLESGGKLDLAKAMYLPLESRSGERLAFRLGDLLDWGDQGLRYATRSFGRQEFVYMFAARDLADGSRFYLDSDGALHYGDIREEDMVMLWPEGNGPIWLQEQADFSSRYDHWLPLMEEAVLETSISQIPVQIGLDANGNMALEVPMLVMEARSMDRALAPADVAGDWAEYYALETALAGLVSDLQSYQDLYLDHNGQFHYSRSPLRYVIEWQDADGEKHIGNLPISQTEISLQSPDYTTAREAYFAALPDYAYFSFADMQKEGNLDLSPQEVWRLFNSFEYDYPASSRLWVGLDADYDGPEEGFSRARHSYDFLQNAGAGMLWGIRLLVAAWLGIFLYLAYTAGWGWTKEGEPVFYLTAFDRWYTEVLALAAAGGSYGLLWLAKGRLDLGLALRGDVGEAARLGAELAAIWGRGRMLLFFGLLGFAFSVLACTLAYSLLRRIQSRSLWKDSWIYALYRGIKRGVLMVLSNHNTAVRTLVPFNLLVVFHMGGLFFAYRMREDNRILAFAAVGVLVLADALLCVALFRREAQMVEIIQGINRIRGGEVEYQLDVEKLQGELRELALAVNHIGEGIRRAVSQSTREEKQKADLITNVSHDIKTPLTSIINYVDLLKRLDLQEERAGQYLSVLEEKSQKLKALADDLVELSKISSGNIQLNMERMDLVELIEQAHGEMEEFFSLASLELCKKIPSHSLWIEADSQRMWRVLQNLFQNIHKYAMPGTRVYLELEEDQKQAICYIKNISREALPPDGEDFTERFYRGDSARGGEGSGLGLSIAKSLVEAQKGRFYVRTDGDLFKIKLVFPLAGNSGCTPSPAP